MNAPLRSLALSLALALPGCGSAFPEPSSADLALARERDPKVTLADLERGRSLTLSRCGQCHALKEPGGQPPERWAPIVDEMRNVHGAKIADAEARDIVRYLENASRTVR